MTVCSTHKRLLSTHRADRFAPKPPDDKPGAFASRIYEAVVHRLRRTAIKRPLPSPVRSDRWPFRPIRECRKAYAPSPREKRKGLGHEVGLKREHRAAPGVRLDHQFPAGKLPGDLRQMRRRLRAPAAQSFQLDLPLDAPTPRLSKVMTRGFVARPSMTRGSQLSSTAAKGMRHTTGGPGCSVPRSP